MNNSSLNWTKEIPTVDGWYWIRIENSYVWIEFVEDSGSWCSIIDKYVKHQKAEKLEFYGPLEEPK